jgi:hypothetical protein
MPEPFKIFGKTGAAISLFRLHGSYVMQRPWACSHRFRALGKHGMVWNVNPFHFSAASDFQNADTLMAALGFPTP